MAESLNESGYDQKALFELFKDGFEVPNTMQSFKDIFRAVGKAMYEIESTGDLDTKQVQSVYDAVDRRFSEITGVHHGWPSKETLMLESQVNGMNAEDIAS